MTTNRAPHGAESEESLMSAHIHSALRYRLTLPAWLIAVALAVALALVVAALVADPNGPTGSPASAGAQPTTRTLPQQETTCVDASVVGHC